MKAQASQWIDQHAGEMIDFLVEFIAHKSDIGHELPVQRDFLLPFLREEMDWDSVEMINACPERERPFINAVWRGGVDGQTLLLNGHVEVVPVPASARERWSFNPWQPFVCDGHVFGRGANDMKGGITAMLWAIKALMALGVEPAGDLLVSLVCGEETGEAEIGTVAAAQRFQEQGWDVPFAIIPEPTHLEIHTLGVGLLDFSITVPGREIHTSMRNLTLYPQRYGLPQGSHVGVDAIAKLARILLLLEEMERGWAMRWRHPVLGGGGYPQPADVQGVGPFTINRTFIEGGTYEGSLPGYAKVEGMISYPGWVAGADVQREFEDKIATFCQLDDWLSENPAEVSVGTVYDWPPHRVALESAGPQALRRAYEEMLDAPAIFSGAKFVGDAAFLQRDCGIDAVYFGPGDLSMGAHGPDEHVPVDHVVAAAKVFAGFILDWL